MSTPYPGYDVLAKWRSPSFDDKTRAVLARRLAAPGPPRFFTPEEFALVAALVERLVPQGGREPQVPLANWIDAHLADGRGEGYHHVDMPCETEAWRTGVAGFDGEARLRHGRRFVELSAAEQEALLLAVQSGDVRSDAWHAMDPRSFFRDVLLGLVASLAYASPGAWSEIGFGGPASPRGYVRLGPNERDPWEAREVSR